MRSLALYFHTLRHLRPIQIVARVWRHVHKPRADLASAAGRRPPTATYGLPVAAAPTLIAADTFRFLNVERRCAAAADWHPSDMTRLWRYHLHYFDDLNASGSESRAAWHVQLLERWVRENPPGRVDGWEPYPLSRRIVNWVKWTMRGSTLSPACHASLAVQARWLSGCLEYDLLGNHLLANAKALIHAGLYFEGGEAEHWYRRGLDIVSRQLREQVLADGAHFELSTMYHAQVLEDLLDLINLLRAHGREVPVDWHERVAPMRRWLFVMSHPDGEIAFFNDAAFDGAPRPAELDAYSARLGLLSTLPHDEPVTTLESSGYARLAVGSARLICDCAPIGPDYLPAHAHADTLSFELSLAGRRVFVNSGTSVYGVSDERLRQRGTAAHNTVVVDGQDSSEVWSGFRVARRAHARLRHVSSGIPAVVEASHDGYRRLSGRNEHTRRWILDERTLEIHDHVSGPFHNASAFLHLHPEIHVHRCGSAELQLNLPGGMCVLVVFTGAASVEVREGRWHPCFGIDVPNALLVADLSGPTLTTRVYWQ